MLEVLHINDHKEIIPRSYFAELINTSINLSYNLAKSTDKVSDYLSTLPASTQKLTLCPQVYIGSKNYPINTEITDLDILSFELEELIARKKDYVTRGQQTVTRYKSMNMFGRHQR